MAALEPKIILLDATSDDVFNTGNYTPIAFTVPKSDASKPPTELFIVAPVTPGTYPVLLFFHGFLLTNSWYTDLLKHIASHGFIVVAPKSYGVLNFICTSISKVVKIGTQVVDWISSTDGLPTVLPDKVNRDKDNLAISGHSRGGKTAFCLALANSASNQKFKALIGIDPVAGMAVGLRPGPQILTYIPQSFKMSVPVAIIGAGLSNQPVGVVPPCAANGVNHSEFFNESKPPVCYFLAKDYGHCDMLDDWIARLMSFICKSGKGSRDLMRKSVGGIVVAFLQAYLGGDETNLDDIVSEPSVAPITLDPVIYVKE